MRPESKRSSNDQFTPRWRHFHPQATLFVRNPFNDDIVFNVADEHNQPYAYRMPAGKVCELPGGAVATLGLKEIVDRLIGENGTDAIRIWEPTVREKYEATVIVRVREAPQRAGSGPRGEVNLVAADEDIDAPDERATATAANEPAFPDAKRPSAPQPKSKSQQRREAVMVGAGGGGGDPDVAKTAAASLGSKDQVIEED